MKLKIPKTGILFTCSLLLFCCNVPIKETLPLENKQPKIPDHWVVLDIANATQKQTTYSWDFKTDGPIDFEVQILSQKPPIGESTATLSFGAVELEQVLKQDYTTQLNKKHPIVSQFKKRINVPQAGRYSIAIEADIPFQQVRLVPSFKNSLGTDQYQEEWLQMHQSSEKQTALEWFKEAKFGMFIHWGLYSQVGGVWKGTKMEKSGIPGPGVAEWLMFKFQISRAEYKELAKNFHPDASFAQRIAQLAKQAGMKYVVITSKHHDGFALFDSACSDFDMVDATPYKRDAIKELYEACLKEGLGFGVYYSHGNDWVDGGDGRYAEVKQRHDSLGIFTLGRGKNFWDPSPNTQQDYLKGKAYLQIKELLTLMPELKLVWFDGTGFITEEEAFRFYKLVYDANPSVLVNRRVGYSFGDYVDFGDNQIPSSDNKVKKYWETCGTTNNSWGYKSYDQDWKSPKEVLYWMIDIVSKGGNYLLNVGPDGNGFVPSPSADALKEIGKWLAINGEAIYGTSVWKVSQEGEAEVKMKGTGHRQAHGFFRKFTKADFWFTSKGNYVYAISLVPSSTTIFIRSLNKEMGVIKRVNLLGEADITDWRQTKEGLLINLTTPIEREHGFVLKMEF